MAEELTKEFITKAKKIHGDKYDYSEVKYIKSKSKVKIICSDHGIFEQKPNNHLSGYGCIKCSGTKQSTSETFISKAKKIHGDKYNYSEVEYTNNKSKINIICSTHGMFEQIPNNHLQGAGCPICHLERKSLTTKEFITKAEEVHDNKYDYSEVKYIKSKLKVKIICSDHGIFEQKPKDHLDGAGCPGCHLERKTSTATEFIIKAKNIHKNKYDYSKVEYINNKAKVEIICPEHGVFKQTPGNHLQGYGCVECSGNGRSTTEEFIIKAKNIHGNKYDYSEVVYINNKTKVKIICSEHGMFEQEANHHLRGAGCPKCCLSKGEEKIQNFLMSENIPFEREKKFKELGRKRFDFYLPELNTIIEYDGKQHFQPVGYWGGEETLTKIKKSDIIKNKFCKNNNINLLRIPYTEFNNINDILKGITWQEGN